jgi:hypothetical protein
MVCSIRLKGIYQIYCLNIGHAILIRDIKQFAAIGRPEGPKAFLVIGADLPLLQRSYVQRENGGAEVGKQTITLVSGLNIALAVKCYVGAIRRKPRMSVVVCVICQLP